MLAPRAALTALALLAAFATSDGTAAARRASDRPTPAAQPTATPIYVPFTPLPDASSPSVAMPQMGITASNAPCMNDQFLAVRAIPTPWQADVIVCGYVTSVSGPGSFSLSVNGTQPLLVERSNLPTVHAGDMVVVHGRYSRSKSGTETIAVTSPGVSLLPAHR